MAAKSANIYISERLKEKLSGFKNTKYTIVHAPVGYGKTQTIKSYLKSTGYELHWVNCDRSKDIFWSEFCEVIADSCDADVTELLNVGFPNDIKSSSRAAKLINAMKFRSKAVLVLDNYNVVDCDMLDRVFTILRENDSTSFKVIFITGNHLEPYAMKLIVRNWIGYINTDDLSFNPEDIIEYFKINGVTITKEQAKEYYSLSNGWPIIVNFQLRHHLQEKNFNMMNDINTFINNEIFFPMPDDEKMFLVKMSTFENFTIAQAAAWNEMSQEQAKKYIEDNIFVKYDSVERVYSMNPLIRRYLEKDFDEIPDHERNDMFTSVGNLYNESGDFFHAVKCYYLAGNFQRMFEIKVNYPHLFQAVIKENKPVFLAAAYNYFKVENKGDYQFAIALVIAMFLYNENALSAELSSQIRRDILKDSNMSDADKKVCLADLIYADSFMHFNNYDKMDNALKVIKEKNIRIRGDLCRSIPFAYGSPSVLLLYHSNPGRLEDEINFMESASKIYYQFTDGHGKGFETVAKAEMYYLRGDIETAEILCLKAMYIADSRNQISVFLAANLILTRISVFTGDELSLTGRLEFFSKKIKDVEDNIQIYSRMVDTCKGFIYASIGGKDYIPEWLKDEKKIEDYSNFITLASANVVYGKYLLLDKQYHHLQAISGQFIGIAEAYSYVIPKIYTYIYIAVSNNETGLPEKACKLLGEAIELACDDMIYMPFVENFAQLSELVSSMVMSDKQAHFIKEVKKIYKIYSKGLKAISKCYEEKTNYGLTARETDIAKLAAKRMSNKEIAEVLFIAESTVKSTMKSVFAKLEINSRAELKNFFE